MNIRDPRLLSEDGISRRAYVDKLTPAELTIRAGVRAVEDLGADVRLTEAVCLLMKAKDLVGDVVDERILAEMDNG